MQRSEEFSSARFEEISAAVDTLVGFQGHTAAEADALWAAEWNALTAYAKAPIVVWPWHDYGPTRWSLDPGAASSYSLEMFTNFIARAAQAGAEFVTVDDLAGRIESFSHSGIVSTVAGNVISVTVSSPHAGDFALDIDGQGTNVIQNVAGWYAYDNGSVFLPETGGTFTITFGAVADDVTHIKALPMRGDLISVTGNGLDLDFSMVGEGEVVIDLGLRGDKVAAVTGATIASLSGDLLGLTLTGLGRHDVTLKMVTPPPIAFVSTVNTVPPAAPIFTGLTSKLTSGTVTGIGSPGSTVFVLDGTHSLGTSTVDSGGNWSLSSANLGGSSGGGGNHFLTATAADAAGNVSSSFGSAQLGGSGADTLASTVGNDFLRGGDGIDTFSLAAIFGNDVIADFVAHGNNHDKIDFHLSPTLNTFANVLSHAAQVGSGVVIGQDINNTLTLDSMTKTNLVAEDFMFA